MSMPQSYPTRICNASRIILYIVQLSNASVLYIEHLYPIRVYIVIVLMMFTQLSCQFKNINAKKMLTNVYKLYIVHIFVYHI